MRNRITLAAVFLAGFVAGSLVLLVRSQEPKASAPANGKAPHDAVAQAQTTNEVTMERPEQKKTAHDRSDVFAPSKALPTTEALVQQKDHGQMLGFDFYRDPLGAPAPGTTFEDIYKAGVEGKPKVMATQRKLLDSRYVIEPKIDP